MSPKIKNLIIFIVIAVGIVLVYIFFIKKGPEQAPLVSVSNSTTPVTNLQPNSSLLTQDFLSVLLNVKNIKLDDTIFKDPAFISLSDSSILLVPDSTEGRPNPFAPIGSDVQVSAPPSTGAGPSAAIPAGGTVPTPENSNNSAGTQ